MVKAWNILSEIVYLHTRGCSEEQVTNFQTGQVDWAFCLFPFSHIGEKVIAEMWVPFRQQISEFSGILGKILLTKEN